MNGLKHAARSLARSPGFSVVAIAILAVGIGASTAVFSVVHALLLRPLAYQDATRLVQVQTQRAGQSPEVLAPATFIDLTNESRSFSAFAAQNYDYVNLTKTASPARVTGTQATADYFRVFGVAPLHGRTWNPDETVSGANPVVVLSESLWRSQFNARPGIIGETAVLDDVVHTVIGVMPASFIDPWGNSQLWRPIAMNGDLARTRSARFWSTFARLADGVTLDQANAELAAIGARLQTAFPADYRDATLQAADLQQLVVGDYRLGLYVVLGAVACVMLITCANVAGLSVVRAIGRRKELAVRAALGASGRQLLRQLLTESLLLSLVAGALGVLLANWGIDAILATIGNGWLPRAGEIELNTPVLLAALALTLVTGVVFGIAPAWGAARTDPNDALKDGGRGSAGPGARRLRAGLVVTEIAVALVLLVSASLLGRSFANVMARSPGMRTDQVLTLGVSLPTKRYDSVEKRRDFYTRVEQAVAAVPGVASVGFTQTMPFTWGIPFTFIPVGPSQVNEQEVPSVFYDSVGVDFFKAAGVPLLKGRTFTAADTAAAPGVVVISASTARRYFGNDDPLGRRLRPTDPTQKSEFEVIGVVGDVLRTGLAANERPLQVYRSLLQRPTVFATLLVQTQLPPETLAKSVQQAIWQIDPDQALESISPVSALIANGVSQPRLYLSLFGLFAAIALILACVGLYGLIAYGVAQRTREFGIRTALGASSLDVLKQVLREGLILIAAGLIAGLVAALATTRLLQTMVYDTSVRDPLVFVIAPLLLALAAGLACLLPARRAARIDPTTALRAE